MKQINYDNIDVQVQQGPGDSKLLAVVEHDQGTIHVFQLPDEVAEPVGAALKGESVKPKIAVPSKKLVVPQ